VPPALLPIAKGHRRPTMCRVPQTSSTINSSTNDCGGPWRAHCIHRTANVTKRFHPLRRQPQENFFSPATRVRARRRRALGIDEIPSKLGSKHQQPWQQKRNWAGFGAFEHADHLLDEPRCTPVVVAHGQDTASMGAVRYLCRPRTSFHGGKAVIILRFPAIQWAHYSKQPLPPAGLPIDKAQGPIGKLPRALFRVRFGP